MWIVDLFGNQIFFPVSLFLYFYWKKNGQLPFPMVIPIEPILGIFGAPAPVITPVNPPTPITPVTPPCNCPPVDPPTPVNPPTPAHPNYQQMARQAIGAMPIDVQFKFNDCEADYEVDGQTETLQKGWNMILSLNFGLWTIPSTAYRAEDPLFGNRGSLLYSVTNDCDSCDGENLCQRYEKYNEE